MNGEESVLDNVLDSAAVESDASKAKPDVEESENLRETAPVPLPPAPTTNEPNDASGSKQIGDTVQKVITSPFDLGKTIVSRAKKQHKRRRNLKNYRLMDDNDIESSYPIMSPPLEILTITITNDSDIGDSNPTSQPTEREQALIAEWSALHDDTSPVAQVLANREDPYLDPYLSSEDEGAEVRSLGDNRDSFEKVEEEIYSPPLKLTTIEGDLSPIKKRKRSSRKSRPRGYVSSSRSVVSSSSLLSYTIEEETAADLEESDASEQNTTEQFDPYASSLLDPVPITRSRSAPNLARFAIEKMDAGKVFDDLKLTGMNHYHGAETFPQPGGSSHGSKGKKSDVSRASDTPAVVTPPKPPPEKATLVPLTVKKVPLFRVERDQIGGIYRVASNISDTSSSDGKATISSTPSRLSRRAREARQARLKRLQTRPPRAPETTDTAKATSKLAVGKNRIPPGNGEGSCGDDEATNPVTPQRPIRVDRTPPRSGGSTTRSTGTLSSGRSHGSGGYFMDRLDVQLADGEVSI